MAVVEAEAEEEAVDDEEAQQSEHEASAVGSVDSPADDVPETAAVLRTTTAPKVEPSTAGALLQTGLLLQLVQRRMSIPNQSGLEHTILNKMSEEINRMMVKEKDEVPEAERPVCSIKRYKDLVIRETKLEKFLKYLEGYEFG